MTINAQFEKDMVDWVEESKQAIQDQTKMILVEIATRLVNRSPIGNPALWKKQPPWIPKNYLPGTFKNNWVLGVDVEADDIFVSQDTSGAKSITRIALAIPRWAAGHYYYFSNNLPYAQRIEDGWSQQAPAGVVARTEQEYSDIVDEVKLRYEQGERPVNKGIPS